MYDPCYLQNTYMVAAIFVGLIAVALIIALSAALNSRNYYRNLLKDAYAINRRLRARDELRVVARLDDHRRKD